MFSDVDNGRENHVTLYRGTHVHKSFSHEDLRSNSASYMLVLLEFPEASSQFV